MPEYLNKRKGESFNAKWQKVIEKIIVKAVSPCIIIADLIPNLNTQDSPYVQVNHDKIHCSLSHNILVQSDDSFSFLSLFFFTHLHLQRFFYTNKS